MFVSVYTFLSFIHSHHILLTYIQLYRYNIYMLYINYVLLLPYFDVIIFFKHFSMN